MVRELLTALWQGALLFLGLAVVFGGVYTAVYFLTWGSRPHWFEGFRDRFRLPYWLDNRFWPWIHQDTEYWVVRLPFDRGPVVVRGKPPHCRYWSITYYPAKEHNASIDTESVRLDDAGRYSITLSRDVADSVEQQTIRVDEALKRGIIELRISLQDIYQPVLLPAVYQNGELIVEEQER